MGNIETGVDKLVQLIKDRKKITLADAAKVLGVSKTVLQEWADFLQEEKVIDIDYKLTSTWLIEKKLTEEDIKTKKSEFDNLKDNFIRKIESSIESVNHETEGIKQIKDEFEKIKKEVGSELDKVQAEAKQLESYENLKRNIDQEIINQQAEFRNALKRAHTDLLEEDKKYQALINTIKAEEDIIKREETDVKTLQTREDQLKARLTEVSSAIDEVHKKIEDNNTKIDYTKEHIKNIEKATQKIEEVIVQKKKSLEPLLNQSKEHEEKIIESQNKLIKKVMENKSKITQAETESKETIEKFKTFFEKKAQIEMLLMKIEEDKIRLKAELNNLIKKSKMFDIVSSAKNSDKHVKELKIAMDEVEKKKETFKQEIAKLLGLVKK